MSNVRCAVYTRMSTEERLEQEFNSLNAQRKACGAFIRSQRGLGWVELLKTQQMRSLATGEPAVFVGLSAAR